jgi:tubulin polyglutamylase complex subunit 2
LFCSKGEIAAFDIDSKVKGGRLALLYKKLTSKPQVWFQDNSCKWFFIANTFTDYFRLMIMHLGLPHW